MVWMYHRDCPEGKLFERQEDAPRGWVDTPAKLRKPKADEHSS